MTRHSFAATSLSLFFSLLIAGTEPARAQATPPPPPQDPPTITDITPMQDDDATLRPMEPDFSLVNLPTTLPLPVHGGTFHLTHRFNDNLVARNTDFGDHAGGLFGLDSGANIGLEYRFGVLRHLQAVVQRTSISQTVQFSAKYDGWRQSATLPVSISPIVSIEGDHNFGATLHGAAKHFSPALGAVVSRTIAERVGLYAMPMWVHNTPGAAVGNRDTGILGLGARLRVMPTTYLLGEVTPRIGGYVLRDPEYGFGIEKRVGAHVFALTFTNTPGTTFRQIALGGNPRTLNLGFNLTRKFFWGTNQGAHTMKHLAVVAVALALGSAGCTKSSTAPSTTPTKPTFTADLRPANEVPPITNAESTGSGTATITFDTTKDSAGNITSATVTFVVNLQGFPAGTPFNIAHIHEGPSTCACPVVVNTTLTASEGLTAINGTASFTKAGIPVADPALAQRIISNPAAFYFNVHSTLNPGGVARGPLVKVP